MNGCYVVVRISLKRKLSRFPVPFVWTISWGHRGVSVFLLRFLCIRSKYSFGFFHILFHSHFPWCRTHVMYARVLVSLASCFTHIK
uniref:Uncharacterized protein n=1 Tax=Anguilla anguilla TaxID=7936 RepID=A0A0E9X2B2_ANGAN